MKIDAPLFHVSLCHDLGCQGKILLCILVLLESCFSLYSLLLGTVQSTLYCNEICSVQLATLGILQAMEIRTAKSLVQIIFCPKFKNLKVPFKDFWCKFTFLIKFLLLWLVLWPREVIDQPFSMRMLILSGHFRYVCMLSRMNEEELAFYMTKTKKKPKPQIHYLLIQFFFTC